MGKKDKFRFSLTVERRDLISFFVARTKNRIIFGVDKNGGMFEIREEVVIGDRAIKVNRLEINTKKSRRIIRVFRWYFW
ncbi:MAG: hypothetical protein Q6362_002765 [Candidatus Wukongarchaeota archaeon]|jgi:hypothetical protein|nr:hypothetical protein [Candidatus Wukongarchaeota archaeon]